MAEYKSQAWHVNVREQIVKHKPVSVSWKRLDRRGLVARILLMSQMRSVIRWVQAYLR